PSGPRHTSFPLMTQYRITLHEQAMRRHQRATCKGYLLLEDEAFATSIFEAFVTMSDALRTRIFEALDAIVLVDPHTHMNAHAPASTTLADIMGYHYYTELAHSAGMPKARIKEPNLAPKEKVGRLVEYLGTLDNTIQSSWLVEMAQVFFGFSGETVTKDNWEPLYARAGAALRAPDWA